MTPAGRSVRAWALAAALCALAGCAEQEPVPTDAVGQEIYPYLKQLRSGNPNDREEGLKALAKYDHPSMTEPLVRIAANDLQRQLRITALRMLAQRGKLPNPEPIIDMLSDKDEQIRAVTCESLGRLKVKAAEEALAACIGDKQPQVRIAAVQALRDLGPSALGKLEKLFRSGSSEDKLAVVQVIGEVGAVDRLDWLAEALKADRDSLRITAAEAMARLRDPRAIKPLLGLIHEPLSAARLEEFAARHKQPPTQPERLKMIDLMDDMMEAKGFARGGPGQHGWVLNPAADVRELHAKVIAAQLEESKAAVRRIAVQALLQIGTPEANTALTQLFHGEDAGTAAAVGEVWTAAPQGVEKLYEVLGQKNGAASVRLRTLELLLREEAKARKSAGEDSVFRALAGDTSEAITAAAAGKAAIVPVKPLSEKLQAAVVAGLQDPDARVRSRCARELAIRKDARCLETLAGLLNESDADVQLHAVRGLAKFEDTRAVPRLLRLFQAADDGPLPGAIIEALAASRDPRAVDVLLPLAVKAGPRQLGAIQALGRIGAPSAGKPLFDALQALRATPAQTTTSKPRGTTAPDDLAIRRALVTALGACRYVEAVPTLIGLVKAGAKSDTENEAMTALGLIGDRRATEVIAQRITTAPYARHTRTKANYTTQFGCAALGRLGDPTGVPALIATVRNPPDPISVEHAATALGHIKAPETVDAILTLLVDPVLDRGIKESAVAPALVQMGALAKAPLLKLLVDTPAPSDKVTFDPGIYAAQLLSTLGAEVLADLEKVAGQKTPQHVQARLVEAVTPIADDRAVQILAGLAKDPMPRVRQWAVVALGRTQQTSAAVPVLKAALDDTNAEVARWARWALQKQGVKL